LIKRYYVVNKYKKLLIAGRSLQLYRDDVLSTILLRAINTVAVTIRP